MSKLASVSGLRARLLAREQTAGLIVKMPACREIDIAASAGFDFVVVDCEHGPRDTLELEHHLRATHLARIPALVRIPSLDPTFIVAAMDAGAAGIVAPHVSDPGSAAAAVAAAHYPPLGHRSIARSTPAAHYGSVPLDEHIARSALETCVVVQIEDEEALERAAEITEVDGVTAVLVGTLDLAVASGWWRDAAWGEAQVDAAVRRVAAAAERQGTALLIPAGSASEAARWRARGVPSCVFVATSLALEAFRETVAAVENQSTVGARDAVILLPGMLCDGALWSGTCSSFSASERTIVGRIDLDDSIAEMAASVLATAPQRFTLVGHSLGAIVALEVIRRAPQRVSRLALINSSARPPNSEQLAAWDAMEARVRAGEFTQLVESYPGELLSDAARSDPRLRQRVAEMAFAIGRDGLLRQLAAQRTRPDMRPLLPKVGCPTIVISGADDAVSPARMQEELAVAIRGARLEVIDDCGHLAPLEQPQTVASLLDQWLEEMDDAPGALAQTC